MVLRLQRYNSFTLFSTHSQTGTISIFNPSRSLCFFLQRYDFIRCHKIKSAFFIRRQRINKADCLLFYFSITSRSILDRVSITLRSFFVHPFIWGAGSESPVVKTLNVITLRCGNVTMGCRHGKILSNFLLLRYLKSLIYNSVAELRIYNSVTELRMSNMISRNEGVWLPNGWVKALLWIFLPCFLYTIISIAFLSHHT